MTTTTLRTLWHICEPDRHQHCGEELSVQFERPDLTKTGQMVVELYAPLGELEALGDSLQVVSAATAAKWPQVTSYR